MTHRKFIVKPVSNGPKEPGVYKHSQWFWHAQSAGKIVAWSGESYVRKSHAIRMASSFAVPGKDTVLVENVDGTLSPI